MNNGEYSALKCFASPSTIGMVSMAMAISSKPSLVLLFDTADAFTLSPLHGKQSPLMVRAFAAN